MSDGFLRRLIGGKAPPTPAAFQSYVLERLRESSPDRHFTPTPDPQIILLGGFQFGLQNLYADYRKSGICGRELDELIQAHFQKMLATISEVDAHRGFTWDEVRARLRPQLMPAEYCDQAPLVNYPFPANLRVGIVLDQERGYSFVKEEDREDWRQSAQDLYAEAISNLEKASAGMKVHLGASPKRYLALEVKDGYDAVRILLPGFRHFIISQLGEPFLASVPNRDFFVAWATDCPGQFHEFTRRKAKKYFGEQPYPLTPAVLRVSLAGVELAE